MSRKVGARVHDNSRSAELVVNDDNNPLPPVEALKVLHEFRPDLVDAAIKMAQDEAKERHQADRDTFKAALNENIARRRTITLISILALIAASFLGYLGKEASAIASCLMPIAFLFSNIFRR